MKKIPRFCLPAVAGIAALMAFPSTSHAYLDPGSGSYIIQIIIAGFVAGSFAIKMYWRKIKAFLQSFFNKSEQPPQ